MSRVQGTIVNPEQQRRASIRRRRAEIVAWLCLMLLVVAGAPTYISAVHAERLGQLGPNALAAVPTLGYIVDLRVTTSDSPDPVQVGQDVQYDINVSNDGPNDATGVGVDVFYSSALTPVAQATPGWSCSLAGVVSCSLSAPFLAGGGAAAPVLRLRFTAPATPQTVQISASAGALEPEANPANNTSIVQTTQVVFGTANLTLGITPSSSGAVVGTPISFTANVANAGPGNAPSLQVTGTLGGAISFSSFGVSPAWSCSHSNGSISCTYQGGTPSGTLASGVNAAPIVINGIAGPAAGSAQISLSATSSAPDPSPANASSSIAVTAPPLPVVDLSLVKAVIGVQPIARDAQFTYRLTVTNSGSSNQTASAIQIDDVLPAGIVLQGFSGAGWSCTGSVVCSYGPTLAIGQSSASLDLRVAYVNAVPPSGVVVSNSASVRAAEPDPNPANNQSTVVASFRGRADLGVQLNGPNSVTAGDTLVVDLVASNSGPDFGANVTAVANIANGFSVGVVSGGAGWSCLASGQSVTCQRASMPSGSSVAASLTLTAPATAGGPFQQQASISGDSFDPVAGNNSASLAVTVTPVNVTLLLSKSDSADPVAVNTEFEYLLIVTNGGAVAQTGISISDPLPGGVSFEGFVGTGWVCSPGSGAVNVISCQRPGVLAPGASSSVRLRVRAANAGSITNIASVSSLQNPVGANASQATTVISSAALSLGKRARSSSVVAGSVATFDLNVGNAGQTDASDVVLVDNLPNGLAAVSASGDGWTCAIAGSRIECLRPTLLRGTTSVVVIEARTSNPGTVVNSAEARASGSALVQASDSITVTAAPIASADLSLDVSDSADPVAQGAEFEYLLRVRNEGPDAATGVRATSVLPAGVQLLASGSAGWSCQAGSPVACTLGAALASGAESVLALRVRATGSGSVAFSASVTANERDPVAANNSGSESTLIQAQATLADLQLSASGPPSATAGGAVELVAQIRNLGPAAASTLLLRAQTSGPWALQSGSGNGFNCLVAGGNLECRGSALGAGATVELRLLGSANATATSALSALLEVSAATPDPSAANNTANLSIPLTVTPPQSADLAITKVDSADPVAFGGRFNYTLTARNLGPGAASNVVIRDLLPATLTLVSASGAGVVCSGGAAVECRASAPLASGQQLQVVVVVEAPAERASISNTASVESSTPDPVSANNRAVETTEVAPPAGSDAEAELESATLGDAIAGDAVPPVVNLCDGAGAAGDISALCDALFADAANGNDAEVNEALRSLYPEEVLSHHASLNQLATTQFFNVDARMSELRGGGGGFSVAGLTLVNGTQAIPLGLFQGLLQDEEPEVGGPGDLISPWGFFVNGTISRGDQEIDSNEREVVTDFDSIGITAGVDYRFSARWVLGAAVGYNQFESDLTDDGKLETSGLTLTGYSAFYFTDQSYFDTRLSYGQVDLDQTRRLVANLTGFTLDETLTSDTSATQLSIAASFGHHFTKGAWTVTPNAFVRYMTSDVDGFAERGSEFGVRYDDQTVKGTVFGVGVQVNRVFSLSNGVLVPQFDLTWNQETGNDDTVIDASYVGGEPGEFFRLSPEEPDDSYGSFGFGLVYVLANGKQAYLQWRESIGVDGLSRSTVNIGARFEF